MKSIISADGKENRLEQEFLWYPSSNGSDGKHRRASDCYLFRPSKLDAIPIMKSEGSEVKTFFYEGTLFCLCIKEFLPPAHSFSFLKKES